MCDSNPDKRLPHVRATERHQTSERTPKPQPSPHSHTNLSLLQTISTERLFSVTYLFDTGRNDSTMSL
ncbi:MAG: hypothetical protein JWM43_1263 [Acidobacteriaceae bacterium]|nr:hypothetical protein [Acidobacteriaceae bacterium]